MWFRARRSVKDMQYNPDFIRTATEAGPKAGTDRISILSGTSAGSEIPLVKFQQQRFPNPTTTSLRALFLQSSL